MKHLAVLSLFSFLPSLPMAFANEIAGAPPTPDCNVTIEKIGSKKIKVGDFVSYFVRIENKSECDFKNLKIIGSSGFRVGTFS